MLKQAVGSGDRQKDKFGASGAIRCVERTEKERRDEMALELAARAKALHDLIQGSDLAFVSKMSDPTTSSRTSNECRDTEEDEDEDEDVDDDELNFGSAHGEDEGHDANGGDEVDDDEVTNQVLHVQDTTHTITAHKLIHAQHTQFS